MRRFVVSTNSGSTPDQDAAFLQILKSEFPNVGWWHQLSETWLIGDPLNTVTSTALRDAAMRAFPGVHIMVVEATGPRKWAGFGPSNAMFKWMRESWDRDT